jgi:hypothetical protein
MPTSDKVINFTAGSPSLALLESDWDARTNGPGVIKYHDFRNANEVRNMRWCQALGSGNDPDNLGSAQRDADTVRHITSDKITGTGCLELRRLAGAREGQDWWLLFSPLQGGTTTGNGRGAGNNDPGALGSITAQAYSPTSGGSQTAQWPHGGWIGNQQYHSRGGYIAEEVWIQAAVKMDSRRVQGINHNEDSGKLFYFTRNDRSNSDQEIVTFAGTHNTVGKNYFRMYRSGSSACEDAPPGAGVTGNQVGSDFAGGGLCRLTSGAAGSEANCWFWPLDEWCTVLYRLRPGTMIGALGSQNPNANTQIEVWAQKQGERGYTRIWNQLNLNLYYDIEYGHNALICSIYHNGATMTEFNQRYTQIIISKEFIPPRQVDINGGGSALALASYGLASNASATFTPGLSFSMDEADMAWQSLFYYDTRNNLIQVMGKRANAGTQWKLRTYNVSTGVWTVNDPTAINRDGHIYGIFTIDPATGNLYLMPGSTPADRALYRFVPSGNSGTWSIVADPLWSGALNMPADGLGWHPHLYGTNGGGCITSAETSGTSQTAAIYKASNNAIQNVSVGSFDSGRFYGQGVYFPKINKVVFGGGSHLHVNATTASGTPTFTAVGAPPIPTKGDTMDNTGFGTMMVHPGNPQKMLLIERGGSRRTWTSTDGDSWTQTGTHPFIQPAYALCSCAPLGTVLALGATGTDPGTPYSVLWKPPV